MPDRVFPSTAARSLFATATAALLMTGCGGSTEVTPPAQSGAIAIAVAPNSVTFPPGGGGAATLTLTRSGGFSGLVNLTVTGAPIGMTIGSSPAQILPGSTTSAVSVTSTGAVAPGTYPLVITGTGSGAGAVGSANDTLRVVVTAPAVTLSVTPGTTFQNSDRPATITATIARSGGFTGAVSLVASGVPSGVTVGFTPVVIPAGATTSTVTITTTNALTSAEAPITINASASGLAIAPAIVTVRNATAPVLAPSVNPGSVTVAAGGSGSAAFSVARRGGFTGDVTLSASGAPAGITATFAQSVLPSTASSTTLNVAVAPGVASGTYRVTLSAVGAGTSTWEIALTVVVPGGTGGG